MVLSWKVVLVFFVMETIISLLSLGTSSVGWACWNSNSCSELNRTGSLRRRDILSVGWLPAPNKCFHLSTEFVRNGEVCCKASVFILGLMLF